MHLPFGPSPRSHIDRLDDISSTPASMSSIRVADQQEEAVRYQVAISHYQ